MIFEGNTPKSSSRKVPILSFDDLMNELGRKMEYQANLDNKLSTPLGGYIDGDADGNWVGLLYDPLTKFRGSVPYGSLTKTTNTSLPLQSLKGQMILIEELVIKPQILLPGESSGGLVVCDTRDMNDKVEGNFQIAVSVSGEEHEFTFNRSFH